ncbi:MAG: septum formation initiator family protein [Chloroflexota bacterium]|nr:septum formation initiator family protein [Chloroflexota bacterium]
MPDDKRPSKLSLIQFLAIITITLSLSLVVDFGRKATASYRIRQEEAQLEQEVTALEARQRELREKKVIVQGEAFVEQWARQEMHMVRAGETAVMPIALLSTQAAVPESGQAKAIEEREPPCWQVWWALFLDVPPTTLAMNY